MIIITGGAGFIGTNFVHTWLKSKREKLLNIDALTYSSNIENLKVCLKSKYYEFIQADISNRKKIEEILLEYNPRAIINFAAETHVDNSILNPKKFFETNVMGTLSLLEASRVFYSNLKESEKKGFKFIQVSTDEVYGTLAAGEPSFDETAPYAPNNPYSASKAASDFLVRSFEKTFKLPCIITHCSNNFGPFQHQEKLIPKTILCALRNKPIPLYGNGSQIRDWIFVEDHCNGIIRALEAGEIGERYNIGANNEFGNLNIVNKICDRLNIIRPRDDGQKYNDLIQFVSDRPGHDLRYAINSTKANQRLNWKPINSFEDSLNFTIGWFVQHLE